MWRDSYTWTRRNILGEQLFCKFVTFLHSLAKLFFFQSLQLLQFADCLSVSAAVAAVCRLFCSLCNCCSLQTVFQPLQLLKFTDCLSVSAVVTFCSLFYSLCSCCSLQTVFFVIYFQDLLPPPLSRPPRPPPPILPSFLPSVSFLLPPPPLSILLSLSNFWNTHLSLGMGEKRGRDGLRLGCGKKAILLGKMRKRNLRWRRKGRESKRTFFLPLLPLMVFFFSFVRRIFCTT